MYTCSFKISTGKVALGFSRFNLLPSGAYLINNVFSVRSLAPMNTKNQTSSSQADVAKYQLAQ